MKATCAVADCSLPSACRGWCRRHYSRWRYSVGSLLPSRPTEVERFWQKVDTAGDCWIWLAHRNSQGYGRFGRMFAHRWAYIDAHGSIPVELVLDHLCRNPSCVRPAHLEAVTNAENIHRGMVGVWQRAKTHCPRGHPYDAENTYLAPRSGGKVNRQCIACRRERSRVRAQRQREAAAW